MSYYMNSCITSEYTDHEVFEVVKHIAKALWKTGTRCYKGPHRALRCGVLNRSSELGLPADIPVLRWVATRPHKLATAPAVLSHLCKKKRSTSKTWTTKAQQDWPINVGINSWLLVCNASWENSILCQTRAKSEFLFSSFSPIQNFSMKVTS
jgi:hypothetical protein